MRKLLLATSLLLAFACTHQQQPAMATGVAETQPAIAERRYSFIMGANHDGRQVVRTEGDTVTAEFEFNDRGRGPKTTSVYELSSSGVPVSVRVTGVDYLKGPVDETFENIGKTVRWKNKAESGEALAGGGPLFYPSMYGAPEEVAILVRALLKTPDGTIDLLPSGRASLREAADADVTAADGTKQNLKLYEISGFAFTPMQVWLDANNDYFASVSSWTSIVREGYESSVDRLISIQDQISQKRLVDVARRLEHHPAGPLVITHANLFDSVEAKTLPGMTIVVRGDRIAAVGKDGSVSVPAGSEVIDAAGKTVIPGLWDMHVHLGDTDGLLDIANGVTTVRDLANDIDFITKLRAAFDSGEQVGPRVILAGILDGPGKYTGPTKMVVDNAQQVRDAIDKYASLGYVQIKIYSSIRPELVPVITKYAHEKGLRVSGHIPAHMTASEGIRDGYDEIQHENFLFLNFWPDVQETQTPLRFTAVGERAGAVDLSSPQVQSLLALMKNRPCDKAWNGEGTATKYRCAPSIVSDPTINVFENMFVDRAGTMSAGYAPIADRLPPQIRRSLYTGGLSVDSKTDPLYRAAFDRMMQFLKLMYDDGIPIVAGTDALAGFALHRELELYVKAGIPAAKVLQIATLQPARIMSMQKDLGSIEAGKLADLVILDGDPTVDISAVRKPVTVIKGGAVFDAKEVAREVGVQ